MCCSSMCLLQGLIGLSTGSAFMALGLVHFMLFALALAFSLMKSLRSEASGLGCVVLVYYCQESGSAGYSSIFRLI